MSAYILYIDPVAWQETKNLPGHLRPRVRRTIDDLQNEPRPNSSKLLTYPGLDRELRRIRLDRWRIVYTIDEDESTINVLAVRKRPPYDYGDLADIIARIL